MSAGMMVKQLTKSRLWGFLNILRSFFSATRSLLFAFLGQFYNRHANSLKREVFADINSFVPSEQETDQIRILEIGIGPGKAIQFERCRLVALDKNPYFQKILNKNLEKHPGIILEKFITERGENMTSVPSNSMDVVISSNIHCSVDDSQSVLKEIKRVLVPGGRYYFFENVLDEPGTNRYKWQMFVNKIRLWQMTWHGCIFDDFEPKISQFGLLEHKAKRYTFQNTSWTYYICYLIASHYGGYAVKEK